ncbi:MAG: TraR/DksA family transcriptional regulator [Myxococcales bacterium]|nr:TraR/DksA family transcriptional regulator [Myxococcales bacterium]
MSPTDLDHFRARLRALRDALEETGPHRLDPNRTDDVGKRDDDHQPLNEMLQSIASSRNRNRTDELRRIKAALDRIEHDPDDYGLCVECEEPIGRRRLELMPAVELCVRCQQAAETGGAPGGRRHLTDYV